MAQALQADPQLQKYLDVIAVYEREFEPWESRVEKILKRYRDEGRDSTVKEASRFNVLWSNVQTLVPACFSRLPQPDVSRRFRDNDQVGRVASLILERSLDFEVQHYKDYRTAMKQAVLDRFLGGRGTAWVRYEPKFKPADQVTEDAAANESEEQAEQLDYECAPVDYVHWKDFGHNVARTWEEVTIVWRQVYMNESAVERRFGKDIANKIAYDATPDELRRSDSEAGKPKKQALVFELWDRDTGNAVWLSKSMKEVLDERPDPLGLQDFFPCPKPVFATTTNDSLIPIPDFALYQDQAIDLDTLSDRISGLVGMLQLKGVYDAAIPALERLFIEGVNGKLLPVKNWAAFAEKQGLKGAIDVVDLTMIANALQTAVEAFRQKKAEVDEISGVIDVMRGQVDPDEKLGQTQMKGSAASLRLKDMQQAVSQFATEILQLKAQIFCKKFNPQTLVSMAAADQLTQEDQQYVGPALELLIGQQRMQDPEADAPNPLRSFRIEVAADTLVELDEQMEKRDRMEMLTAFAGYLKSAAEIAGTAPPLIPLIIEVGKFGLQSFKIGKAIEGTFDTALDQLKAIAKAPPPDPEQMKQQIEQQVKQGMETDRMKAEDGIRQKAQAADQQMQARQMELDKREMEMNNREMLNQKAMQMQGEHQQQMMNMEKQSAEMDMERKAGSALSQIDKREMQARQNTMDAGSFEQTYAQTADALQKAIIALIEATLENNQVMKQLMQIMAAEEVSELVRGEDGRAARSIKRKVLQ